MSTLPLSREFTFLLVHPDSPRGVGVHLCLRHAADLVAAPVRARHPRHAELPRQLAFHRGGRHRLQRTEDRAQAGRVMRSPLPVAGSPGDPGDLIVNVILRITVPAGALQPRCDDQPSFLEPAGFLPVDPDTVIAGASDPGPGLHVLQCGPVGPVQDLLELSPPARPSTRPPAGHRPAGPGARFPGSRRVAPRSTWRTRRSRRCRRRAGESPGPPRVPARSAAPRWRAARRPSAAPDDRRTLCTSLGVCQAFARSAGLAAGTPRRTACARRPDLP